MIDPYVGSPERLWAENPSNFPPHHLDLKINAPIITLRNVNFKAGLVNGMRSRVTHVLPHVIRAEMMVLVLCLSLLIVFK